MTRFGDTLSSQALQDKNHGRDKEKKKKKKQPRRNGICGPKIRSPSGSIARNGRQDVHEKMTTALDKLSVDGLNTCLSSFVCEVRKVDGAFYPSKTLLALVMGIQGWLKSQGVSVDFLNAVEFERLRSVLDAKMKAISAKGIGLVRAQSDVNTAEMEERLWKTKILGAHNPTVLVRTLLYLNGKKFALRGGEEHRRLRFHPAQKRL